MYITSPHTSVVFEETKRCYIFSHDTKVQMTARHVTSYLDPPAFKFRTGRTF